MSPPRQLLCLVAILLLIHLPSPAGAQVNPNGLAYTVDNAFLDRDGVVLLHSRGQSSVFRWSPAARSYLGTVAIGASSNMAAYSPVNHRFYVGYTSGAVRRLDLNVANPTEVPFTSVSPAALGITAAGEYLYMATTNSHRTFAADGTPLTTGGFTYDYGPVHTWDPVKRRIYHFRPGTSPDDLLYITLGADGRVSGTGDSPYHGDFPVRLPIRVSGDGDQLVIGSGVVFTTSDLTIATRLPDSITDALWKGPDLVTLRENSGVTQLQTWKREGFASGGVLRQFNGTPVRMLETSSGILVITSEQGAPRFNLLNDSYETVFVSPVKPAAPTGFNTVLRNVDTVSLVWTDNASNEDSYLLEYRSAGAGAWTAGPALEANASSTTLTGLTPGQLYEFRIAAISGGLLSSYATLVSRTLNSADQPAGEPYGLTITRVYHNSITLQWADNATNEEGFRIRRTLTPSGAVTEFTAGPNATTWTDTGLSPNTTYYYRVQAFNGTVTGDLSGQVSARTLPAAAAPAAPSDPAASELLATSVRLTWTDNSTNEDSFTVERSGVPPSTYTSAGTVGANTGSFVITGLSSNSSYSLRVRATNATGSNVSAAVTVTTPRIGGTFLDLHARQGTVIHFAFSGPSRIERYDLATRAWLAPLAMTSPAGGLWADESGIYASEGNAVIRWNPDGSNRTSVVQAAAPVTALLTMGNMLAYFSDGYFYTRDKLTGIVMARSEYNLYRTAGIGVDPTTRKFFVRSSGFTPSDIVFAEFGTSGKITGQGESPYHGTYPNAEKTFVFPRGGRVADNSGTIYSTDGLVYSNSIGGSFTDMTFYGVDVPVILRGASLYAYTNTLQETGSVALSGTTALRVAVEGPDAFVFSSAVVANGLTVQRVPLASLNAAAPDQPMIVSGVPYTIDDSFLDRDGNISLYTRSHGSLVRWSPSQRRYLPVIKLEGIPPYISYSADSHHLYTAYQGRNVRQLDLSAAMPVEAPLFQLPSSPYGMAAARNFLYISGQVFSLTGEVLAAPNWYYHIGNYNIWDPVRGRVYHFRDGVSPGDLLFDTIDAAGQITDSAETPYHGTFSPIPPIRLNADASAVVLGGGSIFKTSDLTSIAHLNIDMKDGVWKGNTLVTLRLISGLTQLQTWTAPNYTAGTITRQFAGTPERIFNTSQGLVVVTSVSGVPRFTILNEAWETVYATPSRPAAPGSPVRLARSASSVTVGWQDLSNNEDGFRIEYRAAGSTGPWTGGASTPAGGTSAVVPGLALATAYEFRVFAFAGDLDSVPSPVVTGSTLNSADEPAGEPYGLIINRVYRNSIGLSWADNATNETGFRLLRSTTPGGTTTLITLPAGTTSHTDTGLIGNTPYYYRVQAFNGAVDGDLSAQVNTRTLTLDAAPAAPSNLVTSELSPISVRLGWRDNSGNEDNFIVEYAVSPSSNYTAAGTVPYNTTSFSITGLTSNTTYNLRVRAVNTLGGSASTVINVTTPKLGGEFRGHAREFGGIYYFAFSSPNRIERYDLAARVWLTAIPLQGLATALWVDDAGIYAGEEIALVRWNPDGSGRELLATAANNISSIFTIGEVLIQLSGQSLFTTMDRKSGVVLDSFNRFYDYGGVSVAPLLQRAFLRTTSVSPADIHFFDIGSDGKVIFSGESPYHGTYPNAARTFVWPRGNFVGDDSGTVYASEGLSYANTLGSAFKDMTFRGVDVPVVLRGNKLHAYRNTFTEAGSFTLSSATGERVAVNGTDALVFMADGSTPQGLSVQVVPLSSLNAPEPGLPINPEGLAYSVDDAFLDRHGVVHLYSRGNQSVFRWSPESRAYQQSLTLGGGAATIAYSPVNDRLYTGYHSRTIRKLELSEATPVESVFVSTTYGPLGMAAAGQILYVARPDGFNTYGPDGAVITTSTVTSNRSAWNAWDPVRRRMYHFQDAISPNDLRYDSIGADGVVTTGSDTPYHGGYFPYPPIRVSEDGERIALSSGIVFRADDMTSEVRLANQFVDMTWHRGKLLSIEARGTTATTLQQWSSAWGRMRTVALGGRPLRIFAHPDGRVIVVTRQPGDVPRFQILDEHLDLVYDSVPSPLSIVQQPESRRVDYRGRAVFKVVAEGAHPITYQWYRGNEAIPGATQHQLEIVGAGSMDAGAYSVQVNSGTSGVRSSSVQLTVGPVAAPYFPEGALLVSSDGKVHHYTSTGTLVRTIAVPLPPGVTDQRSYDVAVDRLGRLHVITQGLYNSRPQFYLSTFDPGSNSWLHSEISGYISNRSNAEGDLSISGDWGITLSARIDLSTRETGVLPGGFDAVEVSQGLDGELYGISGDSVVRQLNPSSWAWSAPLDLRTFNSVGGLAVDADGRIYTGLAAPAMRVYRPDGSLVASQNLNNPNVGGAVQDVSLSGTGLVAAGHQRNFVTVFPADLGSFTTFPITGDSFIGTYTTWAPALVQPAPAFVQADLPPPALEDEAYSWTPQATHPDPDAVLTFTAVQLPPWLTLSASGQLSGIPLQAHTGSNAVVIRVRDQDNRSVEKAFTVNVTEVNDRPLAVNRSLDRSEDAPAEDIMLSELIADEETAVLGWSVVSNAGGVVSAEILPGGKLRVAYLSNANGPAEVTIRGTDAGGLFAESVIAITVQPVNDFPVGALMPLLMDEDAPVTVIELDGFFSDIESPDTLLSYSIGGNAGGIVAAGITGRQLRITPLLNAFGDLSLTLRCVDPDGGFVEVPVSVSVRSVNDLPVGVIPALSADEDAPPLVVDLAAAFADVETADAALRFTASTSMPDIVQATVSGGLLTLTPLLNANGALTYTVRCEDTDGGVLTLTADLTIIPVNDPPVIPAAIPGVDAGGAAQDAVIDFSPLVTDPDTGDALAWRIVNNTNPSIFRLLAFDAEGRLHIRYTPYVSGDADITVEVSDAAGTAAQRTFRISLPALPPPVLTLQSALTLNRQTGLWEQRITVRNDGLRAVGGFEVHVAGLPAGTCLYNASECLTGSPFTGYYLPVEPGESVSMVLEYYSPGRNRFTAPQLSTVPVLPRDMESADGADFSVDRAAMLAPGSFLLEFPAEPGALYQVQYSPDNLRWLDSLVRIRAAGTRVQWIDQGAPRTISPPLPGQSRFYRIKKLPEPPAGAAN